jgi:hypothetical protein
MILFLEFYLIQALCEILSLCTVLALLWGISGFIFWNVHSNFQSTLAGSLLFGTRCGTLWTQCLDFLFLKVSFVKATNLTFPFVHSPSFNFFNPRHTVTPDPPPYHLFNVPNHKNNGLKLKPCSYVMILRILYIAKLHVKY